MRVHSFHSTNVGYGANDKTSHRPTVEVKQGLNDRLTDAEIEILRADKVFLADMKAGRVKFIQPPLPPAPAKVAPVATPPAKLSPKEVKFLADFYGMAEADRAAFYESLSDGEKALVDANPAKA